MDDSYALPSLGYSGFTCKTIWSADLKIESFCRIKSNFTTGLGKVEMDIKCINLNFRILLSQFLMINNYLAI